MRGGRAHRNLCEDQPDHGEEILARRLHRRRRHGVEQRIARRRLRVGRLGVRRVMPDHAGDAADQQDDRRDRPQCARRGHRVADERLVRPVARIRDTGFAWTVGCSRPRRPEKERGQRVTVRGIGQHVVVHGVLFAQLVERECVAEQVIVMPRDLGNRPGAKRRHGDRLRRRVERVRAELGLHRSVDRRLVGGGQRVVRGAVVLLRGKVAQRDRLAMQPVGRPVGRDVAAVTPDGPELLAAGGEPCLLAALDVVTGKHVRAVARYDARRNRRRRQVDLAAEPAQHRERQDEYHPEPLPQPAGRFHCCTPSERKKNQ